LRTEGNTIVHIDFSIETRDLFRANLSLAKVRLIFGVGFSICLILGLVILFIAIDEKAILLETSPLFVALPLVAVSGQILRLHAVCRKYVASLTETGRRTQYMFYDYGDGYDVASGESFSHISWNDVLRIVEKPNSLQIYLSKYDIRIIPKRGFHQTADIDILRSMLLSSIGARAKLLEYHD
jgi:hypothetical protein